MAQDWQYWRNLRLQSAQKAREKQAEKHPERLKKWNQMRARAAAKRKITKAVQKEITDPYYDYWTEHSLWVCENCGDLISPEDVRSCQAHILPKRPDYGFPSVAGELDNHMTLGVRCGCHYAYDSSWEKASKMPVFQLAKERFLKFVHKVAKKEFYRIPKYFLE